MADDESTKDLIDRFKKSLSEREMKVLMDRFGLDFSGGTDDEILGAMGEITREKIESIERKALKRIRGRDDS